MSEQELQNRLRAHGFKLARQNKHRVYKNASGNIFVVPSTPSDHRWTANALADLARLCGSTETDSRPLRARRPHGKLEAAAVESLPMEVLPPQPAAEPIPAPLSRADQQRLKRWEKHHAQRTAKLDRQREQLREVARVTFELMEDAGWEPDSVCQFTGETYNHIRYGRGFHDVALAVADVLVNNEKRAIAIYVRVNGWILDIFNGVLRESSTWTENEAIRIEVFPDVHPEEIATFVGWEMYFGERCWGKDSIMLKETEVDGGQRFQVLIVMGTKLAIVRDRSVVDDRGRPAEMEYPMEEPITEENCEKTLRAILEALHETGKAAPGDHVICLKYPEGSTIVPTKTSSGSGKTPTPTSPS
jgi:hypothetical protein